MEREFIEMFSASDDSAWAMWLAIQLTLDFLARPEQDQKEASADSSGLDGVM